MTRLLGGLISSTNVTFTFARSSRAEPESDRALAFGAVAANAMLYPRVALVFGSRTFQLIGGGALLLMLLTLGTALALLSV